MIAVTAGIAGAPKTAAPAFATPTPPPSPAPPALSALPLLRRLLFDICQALSPIWFRVESEYHSLGPRFRLPFPPLKECFVVALSLQ
eukprot:4972074-Alexandrium_andersonii.AAC.1